MNNQHWIKLLCNLCQLDIDAVKAYEQALKHIDDFILHDQIKIFQYDHLAHIEDLNLIIRRYGGEPPSMSLDVKGYLIEGMTALRSITGLKGALKAMESNEKMTTQYYEAAINDEDLPPDILLLLNKNYNDEKLHLSYIQQALRAKAA